MFIKWILKCARELFIQYSLFKKICHDYTEGETEYLGRM